MLSCIFSGIYLSGMAEDLLASQVLKFLEVAVHTILYQRGIYPSNLFVKSKKYGVIVRTQYGIICGLISGPLITELCYNLSDMNVTVTYIIFSVIIVILSLGIFILIPKINHNRNKIWYTSINPCIIWKSFGIFITSIVIIISLVSLTFFYPILSIYINDNNINTNRMGLYAIMTASFGLFGLLGNLHSLKFGSLKTILFGLILLVISLWLIAPFLLNNKVNGSSSIAINIAFMTQSIGISFIIIPCIHYLNYSFKNDTNLVYNAYKYCFNIGCIIGPIIGIISYNNQTWESALMIIAYLILSIVLIIILGLICLGHNLVSYPIKHIYFYPILTDNEHYFNSCSCYISYHICCCYKSLFSSKIIDGQSNGNNSNDNINYNTDDSDKGFSDMSFIASLKQSLISDIKPKTPINNNNSDELHPAYQYNYPFKNRFTSFSGVNDDYQTLTDYKESDTQKDTMVSNINHTSPPASNNLMIPNNNSKSGINLYGRTPTPDPPSNIAYSESPPNNMNELTNSNDIDIINDIRFQSYKRKMTSMDMDISKKTNNIPKYSQNNI